MKLLYLSEDYAASKVHHELLTRIADCGIDVEVFTMVRLSDKTNDIRRTYSTLNYTLHASSVGDLMLVPYRLFFGFKRMLKYYKLRKAIRLSNIDFVHAATLFSEGAVARMLYNDYGIQYSVAVRGTDLDLYLSKMPHLWHQGREILSKASKIVFISPLLRDKFFQKKSIAPILDKIKDKCIVIPNGIENFWLDNVRSKPMINRPSRILYIGRFDKNKNVEMLIKAVLCLKKNFAGIHLDLVGGGDACHNTIISYCKKNPDCISYLGKVYDKDKLLKILRSNHIFAMISHSETFGLVYLEALSQGLPILYTKDQGIDHSISDCLGEKASSSDLSEICDRLGKIIVNYNSYQQIGNDVSKFSWDNIASQYINFFNQSLS